MRNLQLLTCHHVTQVPELQGCVCMCVDCDTGKLYFMNSRSIIGLDPETNQICLNVCLCKEGYLIPDSFDHVIGLQHIPDQQSVCAATNKGDVLLINTVTQEVECVGSVDQGLTGISWSPDQELIVLTTGQDNLILMTKDFNPIVENPLHPEDFGEGKPITIGWGKKETQFHGSIGKQAAKINIDPVSLAQEWDDMKIRISWRGDGQYFVVSCISPETGARKLRVWNRECILQYTSENVNGLEHGLCWKPSGSLIVSSQRLLHRHDIVFFEKNGLRHGQFTLPFEKEEVKVKEVQWNLESTILAVWLEDLPPHDSTCLKPNSHDSTCFKPNSHVQLWTVNNYHWYMKQSLQFQANDKLVTMEWDPEHAFRLHLLTKSGTYCHYTWSWVTNHSRGLTSENHAHVAVIDGAKVLMTPFRNMIVPPPMSAYTIQLPTAVNQVVFAPPPMSDHLALVLCDGRIAFYCIDCAPSSDSHVNIRAAGGTGFHVMMKPHRLMSIVSMNDEDGKPLVWQYPIKYHHFHWFNQDTLLAVSSSNDNQDMANISHFKISQLTGDQATLNLKSESPIYGNVFQLTSSSCTGTIAVQLIDGLVTNLENDVITKLPQPCTQMELCQIDRHEVVLGLTERYRFYVNDQDIATNCTSFAVHDEYLLLTTHSHVCRCISLNSTIKDFKLSEDTISQLDENIRRIERGSRIVVTIPGEAKLILQMPRGNLETIYPRALILSTVKKCLDKLDYKNAFEVVRKHRINLNILFDHNPKGFFENTDIFVDQLGTVNFLNLFLTDLSEESVTETIYAWAYRSNVNKYQHLHNKVDSVCEALRESFLRIDKEKYLLSILTSHVKKTTPELETALKCILNLRGTPSSNPERPTADQALKHVLYLVDVNKLYDIALGTYDFDLVLMVAAKSQKDPKEYLPFLNNLKNLERNYQCYSIDKHLGRFSKALDHISKCPGHFDLCLGLVNEQKLYSQALGLFAPKTSEYKAVTLSYGEYLTEKNRHEEAGIMFSLSEQWSLALESYLRCGNWRQVFCLASKLNYPQDKLSQIARRMAGYLGQYRRHIEAAVVLEEYALDQEEAIEALITGAAWEEALRLMHKYNRTDIIETNLKPALKESCQMHLETILCAREEFEKHKARLAVVLENKERMRNELLEGVGQNETDCDLYSDTSSITGSTFAGSTGTRSTFTAYSESSSRMSGRSAKNKRKAASKRRSLREGSEEEDLALLEALQQIYSSTDQVKGEVGVLLKMLILFHFDKEAFTLQSTVYDMLKLLEKSTCSIWPKTTEATIPPSFGPHATSNTIVAAIAQGGAAQQRSSKQADLSLFVAPKLSKDDKWRMHQLEPSKHEEK